MINCLFLRLLRRFLIFDFFFLVFKRRTFVHKPKLGVNDLFLIIVGLFTVSPFGVDRLINFCWLILVFFNLLHEDLNLPAFAFEAFKEHIHAMHHGVWSFHHIGLNCFPSGIKFAEYGEQCGQIERNISALFWLFTGNVEVRGVSSFPGDFVVIFGCVVQELRRIVYRSVCHAYKLSLLIK